MAEGHGLHVVFSIDSVKREFLSEEAGRPIHEDVEIITIMIPGDKNYAPVREATQADRERFPLEYARFKNGMKEEEQAIGTPLKEWPAMSRSMAKDFGHFNVHTVEQLASLSDQAKQAYGMGANEWCIKAKAFLETAKDGAATARYAVENEELKASLAEMRAEMATLAARLEPEKRGPGRPKANRINELVEPL
jgi:hypothetical protein